jgi:flagellar hook-basal body complex protein FliE
MAITPISNIPVPVAPDLQPASGAREGGGFRAVFEGAIRQVENTRHQGAQAVEKFLSGEGEELHTTVMATQRAELAFELFLQVRNKVVQAYQEIMRMQA